jgi:hypothetical protein
LLEETVVSTQVPAIFSVDISLIFSAFHATAISEARDINLTFSALPVVRATLAKGRGLLARYAAWSIGLAVISSAGESCQEFALVVGRRHVASIKAGVEAGASGVTSNAAGSVAGADCGGQNGNGEY